ncbi:MAG: TonB family protein [Deltaproteobacteria bacterium]|nr:TonB family protein [Deltaproteobacteria bacterium]
MGWEGTTLLRVLINPKGETETIVVTRSSGFSTLDKAAVKAVKRWRFHPARSGSEAVESWVKIPIVFDLEEAKN